jgi:hypothetical protein
MYNTAYPTLILAIPGTQETQELPRVAVFEALRRGEIGPDHWVWSPFHNDWKQLGEIPELHVVPDVVPSFVQEPAPTTTAADPLGTEQHAPLKPQEVEIPDAYSPQRMAPTIFSQPQEIRDDFPIFKVIFVILFLAVFGLIGANYFIVDQPFANNLAKTPFGSVQAYAHLGAFAQPNALVIHILPTKEVNPDNFADFLAALAKSTPPQPFNQKPFDEIALTASWQSQYVFKGTDWQKLGQMEGSSSDEMKKFEIEHLEQIDGSSLVNNLKRDDPDTVAAHETKAWQVLVANFLPKSP